MSRYKSIVVGLRLVQAGRKRGCYHDGKHEIHKGELCLEVRDGVGWKGYCVECAAVMVDRADHELARLRVQLESTAKTS